MSSPDKDPSNALTPREVEIMAKVWKCLRVAPEVDLKKLAHECDMTNVGSASNAWGRIKKKLFAGTETPPATPGRKRKNTISIAATEDDGTLNDNDPGSKSAAEDGGAAEAPSTPKRRCRPATGSSPAKKRTPKSAKTPVKVEASDEGDGDDTKIFAVRDAGDQDVDGAV